jgi:hypothetical protein
VLDKQWEPPKKVLDSEDEEGLANEDEPEEEEVEEEEVEEEEVEEEQKEEVEEQEIAGNGDTDDAALSNEALQDQQEVLKIEKLKPKKPIKYHKKVLLYVATTPNNEFLINKQLDKKLVPLSFPLTFFYDKTINSIFRLRPVQTHHVYDIVETFHIR